MPAGNVQGLYEKYASDREPYLRRARACSKVTIPTLMVPEGHDGTSDLPTPWQGMGARGLNNLAAKLLLTSFPPNAPFVKLTIDRATLREMLGSEEVADDQRTEVDKAMAEMEGEVKDETEALALRVPGWEVFKQLLCSGNILCYLPPEGREGMRTFRLDRYVVKRDGMGKLLRIIIKEDVSPQALTDEQRAVMSFTAEELEGVRDVELYTMLSLQPSRTGKTLRWHMVQEISGVEVPKSRRSFPEDRMPYLALRLYAVSGEDYGRGYVEEYLGDLNTLEGLTRSVTEGAAAASKVLFFVNPNGSTSKDAVSRSPNGSVQAGIADDVSVLQMQKFADFRTAQETAAKIEQRLTFAFLLNTAIQRQGERVTAEEIRYMAQELEDTLGGVYSVLSKDFQEPLAKLLISRLQKQDRLPPFPKTSDGRETVTPIITTGIEALGRGQDLFRLRGFLEDVAVVAQADPTILKKLDGQKLLTALATARQVDPDGLVLSEEQFQQAQQMEQLQQIMQQLGPEGIQQLIAQFQQAQQPPQQ